MNKDPERIKARFPIGSEWTYSNHGKRGHNNTAKVADYLTKIDQPDRITHIELSFSVGRKHVVTVNQLGKYYIARTTNHPTP